MDELLGNLLGDLAQSALLAQLKSGFPEVADTVADLRRLVGEVEDIEKAVGQLRGPNAAEAERLWRKLQSQAQAMATAMQADLQHSLELVEGKSFNLTKRALASLPAPAMLRDFQDQTHKAIFQASRLVFSAAPSGIGLAERLALPKLEAFHIKVPGLDERQIVRFSKEYVDNGLRDFNQAKGAVFGELQRAASTVAQSAGLVEARERYQELSRELGGSRRRSKISWGRRGGRPTLTWMPSVGRRRSSARGVGQDQEGGGCLQSLRQRPPPAGIPRNCSVPFPWTRFLASSAIHRRCRR